MTAVSFKYHSKCQLTIDFFDRELFIHFLTFNSPLQPVRGKNLLHSKPNFLRRLLLSLCGLHHSSPPSPFLLTHKSQRFHTKLGHHLSPSGCTNGCKIVSSNPFRKLFTFNSIPFFNFRRPFGATNRFPSRIHSDKDFHFRFLC